MQSWHRRVRSRAGEATGSAPALIGAIARELQGSSALSRRLAAEERHVALRAEPRVGLLGIPLSMQPGESIALALQAMWVARAQRQEHQPPRAVASWSGRES